MAAGSKKHLIDLFMEGQPKADPNKRWTRFDVKAVIYPFIAKSYGQATALTDLGESTSIRALERHMSGEHVPIAQLGQILRAVRRESICRKTVRVKLKKHTKAARKYMEGEATRKQISEMLRCEWLREHKEEVPYEEADEEADEDEDAYDEERERQYDEYEARRNAAFGRIDKELPSIPEIIREYLQETPTATYTTLANDVHMPEIIKRVKTKLTGVFTSD